MRKWTLSACVVLALGLLLLTAAIGTRGPDHPAAQANTSTATSISTANSGIPLIPASHSVAARPALLTHGAARDRVTAGRARHPATWTVRPGDTLSGIAAALGVSGGWQALYAANRHAIGPSPDMIRPGTVLRAPRLAVPAGTHPTVRQGAAAPAAPAPAHTRQQGSRPPSQARPAAGNGGRSRGHLTAPGHLVVQAGGMPRWLEDVLLAAGVLAATAFAAEPAAALARRRKATGPPRARIILADYERLIVTYCPRERTVYVLAPPGEDPKAVLNAARLVLPEDSYQDLAGHLGVPAAWPLE